MKDPIVINDSLKLWPETVLCIRRAAAWLELVTTEGTALIEGTRLEHLLRFLLHGGLEQLKEGMGIEPFGCQVERVTFSQSRRRIREPLTFPDSCPVPSGWLCVEGIDFADYHPTHSLQIIARDRRDWILGFAQDTYRIELDGARAAELLGDFAEGARQVTAWPEERFLRWPGGHRLQADDLEAVNHRRDSWDGMEALKDLRGEAERREFMRRFEQPELGIGFDR